MAGADHVSEDVVGPGPTGGPGPELADVGGRLPDHLRSTH